MAKKEKTKEVEVPVVETPVVETPKPKKVELKKPEWEIKDRMYFLNYNLTPLTYTIKSSNIFWFDSDKNYERELKYTSNQRSVFVDEFKGDHRVAHITFEDGVLRVPKNKQPLQKLLSLYHPELNLRYVEFDSVKKAVDQVSMIEKEIEALMAASTMDIDTAEAIMRVELGSKVTKMSSKELKRDLLLYAKKSPVLFLELASDDNVFLRNVGIKAVEMGMIKLSPDQRTFSASNGRKLLSVPFNEHPYSALAAWFKTDEGMEVYSSVEKQLS